MEIPVDYQDSNSSQHTSSKNGHSAVKEIKWYTDSEKEIDVSNPNHKVYKVVLHESPGCESITAALHEFTKERYAEAQSVIYFLQKHSHQNLIKLIDHLEKEDGTTIIVTEFCETTCLEYTKNNADSLLNLIKPLLTLKKYFQEENIDWTKKISSRHVLVDTSGSQDKFKFINIASLKCNPKNKNCNYDALCGANKNFAEIGCLVLECAFNKLETVCDEALDNYSIEKYISLLKKFGMKTHQGAMLSILIHSLIISKEFTDDAYDAQGFLDNIFFYDGNRLKEFIVDVANFIHDTIQPQKRQLNNQSSIPKDPRISEFITKLEKHSSSEIHLEHYKDTLTDNQIIETFFNNMMSSYSIANYPGYFKVSDMILLYRNVTQHYDEMYGKCAANETMYFFDPKIDADGSLRPYQTCYPLLFVWMWYCTWPDSDNCGTYKKFHMDFPKNLPISKKLFEGVETILFSQESL